MRIGGLSKFSFIDYPGKISAVVFTQGCNFRCRYCFNPELVLPGNCKTSISEDVILGFLKSRERQLEGIVVTGGEPTVQPDLPDFLSKLRTMEYLIKLNTNGSNPAMLEEIIHSHLVDYIAMDIKAPFYKYDQLTGVKTDIEKIKESIELIAHSDLQYEFRTVAVKPLLSNEDLEDISHLIVDVEKYIIGKFVPKENILDKSLLEQEYYEEDEMGPRREEWGKEIKEEINNTITVQI